MATRKLTKNLENQRRADISWDGEGWVVRYEDHMGLLQIVGLRPCLALDEDATDDELKAALEATLEWEGILAALDDGEVVELTTQDLQEIYEQADACLSVGREFLPPAALAVLGGEEPTADYWDWLHTQLVALELSK